MRRSTLIMLKQGLVLLLGLTLIACGEKESAQVDATPREAAPQSEEAKAPEPAKAAPTYEPPEALSPKESRKAYPWGKRKAAKKKNTAALKARKKGDSEGALAAYKEALTLSPGYVTARFNLACEYARFGKADEAIVELEHLYKMATPEAMRKLGKLQVDKDFDPIRGDHRIKAIEAGFKVDFDAMLFEQICGNEGKIITMMDNENGLYGIKTRMDRSEGVLKGKGEILKGGKARTQVFKVLDVVCDMGKIRYDEKAESRIVSDTKLSKWTEKHPKRCVKFYGNLEGDPEADGDIHGSMKEGALCFIRQGESWMLGVAGVWSADGADTDVEPAVDAAVKEAVSAWGS